MPEGYVTGNESFHLQGGSANSIAGRRPCVSSTPRLRRTASDEVVVSFRDLPDCLTSGRNDADALTDATDALEETIAGRIIDGGPIRGPSARRTGEHRVAVPSTMAAKAALVLAFRDSGLSRVAFARRLGVDDKVVRRMLDPRHATATNRLHNALRLLGRELVVESAAA